LTKRVLAASAQPFHSLLEACPLARGEPVQFVADTDVSLVPNLETAARSAAVRVAPMVFILPVSSAARIAFADIFRKVSGGGAPIALPTLWQVAQRD
jgi:hypothetical protein